MLTRRITRLLFCTAKNPQPLIPKPPKLLSGQLEPFRYDFENSQLYEGFSMPQLYGAKVGYRHPPAVRAQMVKDTIGSILVFVIMVYLSLILHAIHKKEMQGLDRVKNFKKSKIVELPQPVLKNPIFD